MTRGDRRPSRGLRGEPADRSLAAKDPASIAGMFDRIARRYDLLNRLLSGGLDQRWRVRAIDALQLTGRESVLDVCTGTADLALAARRGGAASVVGVDFAHAMLRIGLDKVRRAGAAQAVHLVRGDALQIPVASASTDAATVAFGVRNVQDLSAACAELARVLRPGGRLAILEFALPRTRWIRRLYLWYFEQILPRIGRAISRHAEAYSYLPASVGAFPEPVAFATLLSRAGFRDVTAVPLTLGIVYLYTAQRVAAVPDRALGQTAF